MEEKEIYTPAEIRALFNEKGFDLDSLIGKWSSYIILQEKFSKEGTLTTEETEQAKILWTEIHSVIGQVANGDSNLHTSIQFVCAGVNQETFANYPRREEFIFRSNRPENPLNPEEDKEFRMLEETGSKDMERVFPFNVVQHIEIGNLARKFGIE